MNKTVDCFKTLNISKDTFDDITMNEKARNNIFECLLFCFHNVPQLKIISSQLLQYMAENNYEYDGGPGSGNFGHEGRKGELGGSAPSSRKIEQYHARLDKEKEELLSQKPNKAAYQLMKMHAASKEDCVKAMKNGTVEELAEEYYNKMKSNGDPTPDKPVSGMMDQELQERINSGQSSDYTESRIEMISDVTGQSREESLKTAKELSIWFGGSWSRADTETLDKYVEQDHAYNGEIHRGMHFEDKSDLDAFMDQVKSGTVSMNRNASWSNDEEVARGFAHADDWDVDSVVLHCVSNRTSAPVSHLSTFGENEVLSHSKARWSVLYYTEYGKHHKNVDVYLVEKGDYDD